MLLRMKVGGKKLTLDPDKLTLGEAHLMEHDFGLGQFGELSIWKPGHLLGYVTIAVQRANPEMSKEQAQQAAEGVEFTPIFEDILAQIRVEEEKAEAEAADPPVAAVNGSAAAASSPAKTRKGPGRQRTSASTG